LYRQILVAHSLQRYELISMVAGSITSVALNLALVPRFAVVGSAVASVLSTAAVLVFAYSFVHRHITAIPCARHLAKPLLAGAGMLALAIGLAAAPLALQGAASLITYIALFFLLRGTTTGELRAVWKTTGSAG
jgi:O-antigen/teichoic acid export membrane protein